MPELVRRGLQEVLGERRDASAAGRDHGVAVADPEGDLVVLVRETPRQRLQHEAAIEGEYVVVDLAPERRVLLHLVAADPLVLGREIDRPVIHVRVVFLEEVLVLDEALDSLGEPIELPLLVVVERETVAQNVEIEPVGRRAVLIARNGVQSPQIAPPQVRRLEARLGDVADARDLGAGFDEIGEDRSPVGVVAVVAHGEGAGEIFRATWV